MEIDAMMLVEQKTDIRIDALGEGRFLGVRLTFDNGSSVRLSSSAAVLLVTKILMAHSHGYAGLVESDLGQTIVLERYEFKK